MTTTSNDLMRRREQATQWDEAPCEDMDWQEQAVALLEGWRDRPVTRAIFAHLPPPPGLGAEDS